MDAKSYLQSGVEKTAERKYAGAVVDFSKAIHLNPRLAEAFAGRGYARYMLEPENALADINRALELNPKIIDAYVTRGFLCQDQEDHEAAVADLPPCSRCSPATQRPTTGVPRARVGVGTGMARWPTVRPRSR